jgi:hypothetical protein
VRDYYKGKYRVKETAKDHIMGNHIDGALDKSRYETDPPQGRDAMFLQVWFYNLITFVLGTRSDTRNKKGELVSITFTFTFPAIPVHPVYKTKGQGWIGRDQHGNTIYKTLFTLTLIARPSGIPIPEDHNLWRSASSCATYGIRRTPMVEETSKTTPEELCEPSMQLIMLVHDTEAFAERGVTSKQDRKLDIRLTYPEWLALYFDALGLDKTAFDQVKAESYSSQDGIIVILGEFDEEIPGFPMLSRIRGPYHDAIFEVNEIEDLREECLRVKASTSNALALQGIEKLLIISEQARSLGLIIYFVSN